MSGSVWWWSCWRPLRRQLVQNSSKRKVCHRPCPRIRPNATPTSWWCTASRWPPTGPAPSSPNSTPSGGHPLSGPNLSVSSTILSFHLEMLHPKTIERQPQLAPNLHNHRVADPSETIWRPLLNKIPNESKRKSVELLVNPSAAQEKPRAVNQMGQTFSFERGTVSQFFSFYCWPADGPSHFLIGSSTRNPLCTSLTFYSAKKFTKKFADLSGDLAADT